MYDEVRFGSWRERLSLWEVFGGIILQVLKMERYRYTYFFSQCVLFVPLPPWGVFLRQFRQAPASQTRGAPNHNSCGFLDSRAGCHNRALTRSRPRTKTNMSMTATESSTFLCVLPGRSCPVSWVTLPLPHFDIGSPTTDTCTFTTSSFLTLTEVSAFRHSYSSFNTQTDTIPPTAKSLQISSLAPTSTKPSTEHIPISIHHEIYHGCHCASSNLRCIRPRRRNPALR